MNRIGASIFAFAVLAGTAFADELSRQDQQSMQSVITEQLQAFAVDNGDKAFSFAAPLIKEAFSDTDTFMLMVKRGYGPAYRNKSYSFGESFVDHMARPSQRVRLTALDGKGYEAIYTLERQADGSWKISGCHLVPVSDPGV